MLFRQCLIRYMQPQSQERLQTLQLFRWRSLTLSTKHHRRSLLKRLAVRRMLYQSILMESWPESKSAEGKRCTINRDDCSLKRTDVQGWFKYLGKLYKEWAEDCVSAWRARHTELLKGATTDAFLISSLNQRCQKGLTQAEEKKNWTVAQSKVFELLKLVSVSYQEPYFFSFFPTYFFFNFLL